MPITPLAPSERKRQLETFVDFFVKEFMAEISYLEEATRGNVPVRQKGSYELLFKITCALVSLAPIPGGVLAFMAIPHALKAVIDAGEAIIKTEAAQIALQMVTNYLSGNYREIQDQVAIVQGEIGGSYSIEANMPIDTEVLSVLARWLGVQLARRYEQALTERLSTQPDQALVSLARVGARRCLSYLSQHPFPAGDYAHRIHHLLSGVVIGEAVTWYERPLKLLGKEASLLGRDEAKTLKFTAEKLYMGGAWTSDASVGPVQCKEDRHKTEWLGTHEGTFMRTPVHEKLIHSPRYGYIAGLITVPTLTLTVKASAHDLTEWQQRRLQQPVTREMIATYLTSPSVMSAQTAGHTATETLVQFLHARASHTFPAEAQAVFCGDLKDLTLTSGNFQGVDFSGSQLSGDVSHVSFEKARLYACTFTALTAQAESRVNFAQTELGFSTLLGARLLGEVDVTHADLTGVNLTGSVFGTLDHVGARWHKAVLTDVTYSGLREAQDAQVTQLAEEQAKQRAQLRQLNLKMEALEAKMASSFTSETSSEHRNALENLLLAQVNQVQFNAYSEEKLTQHSEAIGRIESALTRLHRSSTEQSNAIARLTTTLNIFRQKAAEDQRAFEHRMERLLREKLEAVVIDQREREALILKQLNSLRDHCGPAAMSVLPKKFRVAFHDIVFENKLEEGDFGAIFQGTWEDQAVTIKCFDHFTSESESIALTREAELMSRLNHTSIAHFYGACLDSGRNCLLVSVMEKGHLETALSSLTLFERWMIAKDLAQGLAYLHEKPIIHGDIHPKHVGVNRDNQGKWINFGLAKVQAIGIATMPKMSKEVAWQAPESWQNRAELTTASDIYSFGMLLWTLITGRLPYADKTLSQVVHEVQLNRHEPLLQEVPSEYRHLIAACWSFDATSRPTASAIIEQLAVIELELRSPSPTGEAYNQQGDDFEDADQLVEAYHAYQRAAEKHYPQGLTNFGLFALQGRGGHDPDKRMAQTCFEQAAARGHARAAFNLGRMFEKGDTADHIVDIHQALRWYTETLKLDPEFRERSRCQDKITTLSAQKAALEENAITQRLGRK